MAHTESKELMGNLPLALRELLAGYAAIDRTTSARRRLVALSVSSSSGSGETPLEADHGR